MKYRIFFWWEQLVIHHSHPTSIRSPWAKVSLRWDEDGTNSISGKANDNFSCWIYEVRELFPCFSASLFLALVSFCAVTVALFLGKKFHFVSWSKRKRNKQKVKGENEPTVQTMLSLRQRNSGSEITLPKPLRNLLTLRCSFSWMESRYSWTLTSNSPEEREGIMNHWIASWQRDLFFFLQLFTSQSLPVELSLLDEPAKHLGLHEDLQEATHSLRRDCFTKTLALEGAGDWGGGRGGVTVFPFTNDEEGIVAYQLHEETNKGLGHNSAKMAKVWKEEDKHCNIYKKCCWTRSLAKLSSFYC